MIATIKSSLLSLFCLCSFASIGSNNDSLRYEMLKASVAFYASDTKSFPDRSAPALSCSYPDVACLYVYCEANKLTGVDQKLKQWQRQDVKTPKQMAEMSRRILQDITRGRTYRKELPQYSAFEKQIETLGTVAEVAPQSPKAAQPEQITDPQNAGSNASPEADTNPQMSTETPIIEAVEPISNWFGIIALALAGLSVLVAIWAIFKVQSFGLADHRRQVEVNRLRNEMDELRTRVVENTAIITRNDQHLS